MVDNNLAKGDGAGGEGEDGEGVRGGGAEGDRDHLDHVLRGHLPVAGSERAGARARDGRARLMLDA